MARQIAGTGAEGAAKPELQELQSRSGVGPLSDESEESNGTYAINEKY